MTTDILSLLVILLAVVILFVTEWLRSDVIAIMAMLSLVWTGILTPPEAFSGFSSNAVMSIVGVMIIGHGVEKSGLMRTVSGSIVKLAGKSENKLITLVSLAVGTISSFLPNIGAAALFLPPLRRIAGKTETPLSHLLMPMGFAAILGGTLTMVGSGPMLLLNDLLHSNNLEVFNLFGSTPLGLALLTSGTLYFLFIGKYLLPRRQITEKCKDRRQKLIDTLHLHTTVYLFCIPENCPLTGKTREEAQLWKKYKLNLLALSEDNELTYAPWRMTRFTTGQELAVLGKQEDVERFSNDYSLETCTSHNRFSEIMNPETAGFAELIILPGTDIVAKSFREIGFRKNFDVEPVILIRGNSERRGNFADIPLAPGDIVIVYSLWEKIERFKKNEDFVVPTPVEVHPRCKGKTLWAAFTMVGVIVGVAAGFKLPLVLLTGAVVMILSKTVNIDEAYHAVDWRTLFLLAGLIPLGIAMEKTGAAVLASKQLMTLVTGSPVPVLLLAIGLLTTIFTLFMSNYAATVMLVPLVVNVAQAAGIDPRAAAMLVAVCASNSFVLPTHQVNAFLMSPGGYRTEDYLKAGGLMSLVFLTVSVTFIYIFFL